MILLKNGYSTISITGKTTHFHLAEMKKTCGSQAFFSPLQPACPLRQEEVVSGNKLMPPRSLYGKKVVTLSQQTGNPANHFKDYCHQTVTANPAVFIKVSVTD